VSHSQPRGSPALSPAATMNVRRAPHGTAISSSGPPASTRKGRLGRQTPTDRRRRCPPCSDPGRCPPRPHLALGRCGRDCPGINCRNHAAQCWQRAQTAASRDASPHCPPDPSRHGRPCRPRLEDTSVSPKRYPEPSAVPFGGGQRAPVSTESRPEAPGWGEHLVLVSVSRPPH